MNIVGYVRVSTTRQAEEGVSIDMQQQMIISHARMLELIEDERDMEILIDDGYSSSTLERPAMKDLISLIKEKKIDLIFTYRFDRISRDIIDSNIFLGLLKKYDVKLKCLKEEVKTKTAGDRFGTNVKIVANQYEREIIVERTNDGLRSIVEGGRYPCGGGVPLGYMRGKDKNIYINSKTAWIILEIFNLAVAGETYIMIAKIISKKTKVKKFNGCVIEQIVQDIRYTGDFFYKGKEYLDIIPAIVTKELRNQAIANHGKIYAPKSKKYYLYDLLRCDCGTELTCTHSIGKTGKKYYYYRCANCNQVIPQNLLLEKLLINTGQIVSTKNKHAQIKKEIRIIKRRMRRIKENYVIGNYTEREYCFLVVPLDEELQELNMRLKTYTQLMNMEEFDLLSAKEKRIYLRSIYKKITVSTVKKKIVNIEMVEL